MTHFKTFGRHYKVFIKRLMSLSQSPEGRPNDGGNGDRQIVIDPYWQAFDEHPNGTSCKCHDGLGEGEADGKGGQKTDERTPKCLPWIQGIFLQPYYAASRGGLPVPDG